MIGNITFINNIGYLQVNDRGTVEKLPAVRWYARAYLEILQGIGKPMSVAKVRKFVEVFKK